jgi:hypothetical protein
LVLALDARPPIEARGTGETALRGPEGGAIEVRPVVLNPDFVLESEILAVVAGVPVRGVEEVELAEEIALEGDLVGDCNHKS